MNMIMKTKYFFLMAVATMILAVPVASLRAEEVADTTQSSGQIQGTVSNKGVSVNVNGMTVNGKPATRQQKAVAKQMTRQGAQMAKKGVQLAMSAVTNPDKAEKLGEELEQMGDEMERLGDSLEVLAEDTTFFYEGEDSDDVELLSENDIDEIGRDFEESFGWLNTWWGKLLGGGLGILGGLLAVLLAIFVVVFLFALFTSPIWVLALVIWLIIRGSRTKPTTTYQNPPMGPAQPLSSTPQGGEDAAAPQSQTDANAGAQPQGQQAILNGQPIGSTGYVQPYPDENAEMWKSGIMWSCVGVGLILVFLGIGLDGLWGIGALVACIGVAKLVIATTTKKKQQQQTYDPSKYQVVEENKAEDGPTYHN